MEEISIPDKNGVEVEYEIGQAKIHFFRPIN